MKRDQVIFDLIEKEHQRQLKGIELIASENFVSDEVMEAMGSYLTNKYAEGYPGKRYYGGCQGVSGRGYDVSVLHRVVEQAGCDKACRVSHINHKQCANLVGNLTHALVVPLTAVGRATADDELRLVLFCQAFHFVIVNASRHLVQMADAAW